MISIRQISRFGFVGVAATAVHAIIGLGLHDGLGVTPLLSNFFGFCSALCISFFGQTRLTFPSATADVSAFARFASVALTGLALNQSIVWVVTSAGKPYWLALAIIITTVPVATFLMLKFWALRK